MQYMQSQDGKISNLDNNLNSNSIANLVNCEEKTNFIEKEDFELVSNNTKEDNSMIAINTSNNTEWNNVNKLSDLERDETADSMKPNNLVTNTWNTLESDDNVTDNLTKEPNTSKSPIIGPSNRSPILFKKVTIDTKNMNIEDKKFQPKAVAAKQIDAGEASNYFNDFDDSDDGYEAKKEENQNESDTKKKDKKEISELKPKPSKLLDMPIENPFDLGRNASKKSVKIASSDSDSSSDDEKLSKSSKSTSSSQSRSYKDKHSGQNYKQTDNDKNFSSFKGPRSRNDYDKRDGKYKNNYGSSQNYSKSGDDYKKGRNSYDYGNRSTHDSGRKNSYKPRYETTYTPKYDKPSDKPTTQYSRQERLEKDRKNQDFSNSVRRMAHVAFNKQIAAANKDKELNKESTKQNSKPHENDENYTKNDQEKYKNKSYDQTRTSTKRDHEKFSPKRDQKYSPKFDQYDSHYNSKRNQESNYDSRRGRSNKNYNDKYYKRSESPYKNRSRYDSKSPESDTLATKRNLSKLPSPDIEDLKLKRRRHVSTRSNSIESYKRIRVHDLSSDEYLPKFKSKKFTRLSSLSRGNSRDRDLSISPNRYSVSPIRYNKTKSRKTSSSPDYMKNLPKLDDILSSPRRRNLSRRRSRSIDSFDRKRSISRQRYKRTPSPEYKYKKNKDWSKFENDRDYYKYDTKSDKKYSYSYKYQNGYKRESSSNSRRSYQDKNLNDIKNKIDEIDRYRKSLKRDYAELENEGATINKSSSSGFGVFKLSKDSKVNDYGYNCSTYKQSSSEDEEKLRRDLLKQKRFRANNESSKDSVLSKARIRKSISSSSSLERKTDRISKARKATRQRRESLSRTSYSSRYRSPMRVKDDIESTDSEKSINPRQTDKKSNDKNKEGTKSPLLDMPGNLKLNPLHADNTEKQYTSYIQAMSYNQITSQELLGKMGLNNRLPKPELVLSESINKSIVNLPENIKAMVSATKLSEKDKIETVNVTGNVNGASVNSAMKSGEKSVKPQQSVNFNVANGQEQQQVSKNTDKLEINKLTPEMKSKINLIQNLIPGAKITVKSNTISPPPAKKKLKPSIANPKLKFLSSESSSQSSSSSDSSSDDNKEIVKLIQLLKKKKKKSKKKKLKKKSKIRSELLQHFQKQIKK